MWKVWYCIVINILHDQAAWELKKAA